MSSCGSSRARTPLPWSKLPALESRSAKLFTGHAARSFSSSLFAVAKASVGKAASSLALLSSAWAGRISELLWRDSEAARRLLVEAEFCRSRGLMTPEEALGTEVVHLRAFLTHEEVEDMLEQIRLVQADELAGKTQRDSGFGAKRVVSCWQTTYLHTDHIFQQRFGALHTKLRRAIFEADAANWKVLQGRKASALNFRTAEFHEYTASGQLSGEKHFDAGSLITMDVLLSDPGTCYTGGALVLPGPGGSLLAPALLKGDAALFISHRYHNVQPVTGGKRSVLVVEIWDGPECSCAHRCRLPGPCTRGAAQRQQQG